MRARHTIVSILLLAELGTASCTNLRGATRTRTEGALVGTGIGAGIGAAITGNERGAKLGAAAGGLLGFVVGFVLGERQEQLASNEQSLQADIAALTARTETLRAENRQLASAAWRLDAEIEQARLVYAREWNQRRRIEGQIREAVSRLESERQTLAREVESLREQEHHMDPAAREQLASYLAVASERDNTMQRMEQKLQSF